MYHFAIPAESEVKTLETRRIIATTKNSQMEMGRNWDGFYSRITPYPGWL
jgi:hypothetical protein